MTLLQETLTNIAPLDEHVMNLVQHLPHLLVLLGKGGELLSDFRSEVKT